MYIEYEVDLGSNIMKNGRKTHILGKIRGVVPVQVVFCFSVSTSIRISAITCSFLIRFQ